MFSGLLLKRSRRVQKWNSDHPDIEPSTPTELHVLRLVADDKSNKDIGGKLFISSQTVKTNRTNIMAKLNFHGCHTLVAFAMERKAQPIGYNLIPSDQSM